MKRSFISKTLALAVAAAALFAPHHSRAADMDSDGTPDEADAVPCDPRASTVAYAPAQNQQGALVFEDSWPSTGDLDFNDVVLNYNYIFFLDGSGKVASMQATITLMAAGGTLQNAIRLHLPVPSDAASAIKLNGTDGVAHDLTPLAGEHELVLGLFDDVTKALGGALANVTTNVSSSPAVPLNLYVKFATPVAIDLATAPFDLYLDRVNEPGHQIHQLAYGGTDTMDQSLFGTLNDGSTASRHFVDTDGLPFALAVPASFQWPNEDVTISTAYPDITAWATSGGTTHADWYATNQQASYVWSGGANGSPPPTAGLLGPTDPTEDVKCAPWKDSVEFGVGPYTFAYASTTDSSRNVLVVGYGQPNNKTAAFVTKYDSSKNQIWSKTLAATDYSEAFGVASDADGNVYVSGQVSGSFADEPTILGNDPFVIKLDSTGKILWTKHLGDSTNAYTGYGLTMAHDGTLYTVGTAGSGNPFVAQLDTDGNVLLFKTLPIATTVIYSVAPDNAGNLFLGGYQYRGTQQATIIKIDASGAVLWSHQDTAPLLSQSDLVGIAGDGHGNAYESGFRQSQNYCYQTCYSCGSSYPCCYTQCNTEYDATLWKYDTNGNNPWTRTVLQNAEGFGVTVDHQGSAIVAGYDTNSSVAFVSKILPSGNTAWLRREGAAATEAIPICLDPSDDSVFISGGTSASLPGAPNTAGQFQAFISKYNNSGTLQ